MAGTPEAVALVPSCFPITDLDKSRILESRHRGFYPCIVLGKTIRGNESIITTPFLVLS